MEIRSRGARINQLHDPRRLALLARSQLSPLLMHGFAYGAKSGGQPGTAGNASGIGLFFRYTLPGYALALLISGYMLWIVGRCEGLRNNPRSWP